MTIDNLLSETLTEEEKIFLQKIEQKISEKLKDIDENKYNHLDNDKPLDLADKHPETIEKQHISGSPHEIKISVVAQISSVDDKGYLNEIKEIIRKNYHIPVVSDQDYNIFANKFFENFENKLTSTCQEMIQSNNE